MSGDTQDHGKKAVNKLEIFITLPQGETAEVTPWVIYYTARRQTHEKLP